MLTINFSVKPHFSFLYICFSSFAKTVSSLRPSKSFNFSYFSYQPSSPTLLQRLLLLLQRLQTYYLNAATSRQANLQPLTTTAIVSKPNHTTNSLTTSPERRNQPSLSIPQAAGANQQPLKPSMIPKTAPGPSHTPPATPRKEGVKQTQKRPTKHQPSTSAQSIPSSQPSTSTPASLPKSTKPTMIPGMAPGPSSTTLVSPSLTEKGGLKQTQKRPRQRQPSTSVPSISSAGPSTCTFNPLMTPSPINHARRSTHNNQQGGANLQPNATVPGPSNIITQLITSEQLLQLLKQTQHLHVCQPVVSVPNHTPLPPYPPAKRPKLSLFTAHSNASSTAKTANHSADNQQARQANLQPTVNQTTVLPNASSTSLTSPTTVLPNPSSTSLTSPTKTTNHSLNAATSRQANLQPSTTTAIVSRPNHTPNSLTTSPERRNQPSLSISQAAGAN